MLQILLVEDNFADVLLVQQVLEDQGIIHKLHVMSDGAEALTFVAGIGKPDGPPCPDLLVLDVNLPKVEGPQVLEEFRKHPAGTQTPVIVVTSSDALRDRKLAEALGADAYFQKPCDLDEFMKLGGVIRNLLGPKAASL